MEKDKECECCEVKDGESDGASCTLLKVEGIDCPKCAEKIEKFLLTIPGISSAKADITTSTVDIDHTSPRASVIGALERAGYKVTIEEAEDEKQPGSEGSAGVSGSGARESTLRLEGLECADCVDKLEKRLAKHTGVISVKANFGASSVKISYTCPLEEIVQIIKDSGYRVADTGVKVTTFDVKGLDCIDCAHNFEKFMQKIPGVVSTKLNFGAAKIRVEYECPKEILVKAASDAGYKIAEIGTEKAERKESAISKYKYEISSGISAVFLAAGFAAGLIVVPELYQILLFALAIIAGGFYTVKKAIFALRTLTPDMNLLMAVAVIGAIAIGKWEEAATVTFLFAFGNALQSFTLDRTRNSIRELMKIAPKEATVIREGKETRMSIEQISVGDIIVVKPGEKIAMDGEVARGTSYVNQAPITGESMPVEKREGSDVFAGTINERGALEVRVTRLAKDNTLSKIIQMVEEAQTNRAPSQEFVDRFAKYYTPAVLILAFGIAVVPALFGQPFDAWLYRALVLLVIACPCALVISTPVSIVAAIGNASRNGVLVKGGAYLEEIGKTKAIAFDKTGTLTVGKPAVTEVVALNSAGREEILNIAATLESRSEHPLALAIVEANGGKPLRSLADFEAITGKGIRGKVDGKNYRVGNLKMYNGLASDAVTEAVERLQRSAMTPVILADDREAIAVIGIADQLRPESADVVQKLHKVGVNEVLMLTGDNDLTAIAISGKIGLDGYYADLLPQDKAVKIDEIKKKHEKVVMVGDGINDAPALARSTVGIAMGVTGSDTALETADIALMSNDISRIEYVVRLGKRTLSIIQQNIALSLAIKLTFIALALFGISTLWMAVFADTGVSILVTLNGMRLLRTRK
ncbi:MAG TPA: heavy metal translocating P-type ATPase [Methanocella sp.]|nr:heavy metal translocating P-type ATPase [Methanocella sp.]